MQRFDYFKITAEKTKEGFIRDKPIIARSGLLRYINADGTERIEYRPPDEAFDEDSLNSIMGKPITLGHPGMVSSENAGNMPIVGAAISKGYRDGDAIRADVSIFQLPTADRELSCGYTLDLDETPGTTPTGDHYDAIQRNVRVNHIAIVPRGRAGIARLNMDGNQEFETDGNGGTNMADNKTMSKIRLDGGLEYEAAPEVVVAFDKIKGEMEQVRKDAAEAEKTAKKNLDEMQAKVDSLTSDLDKAKKDMEEAEAKHKEAFDAAVKSRVELLDIAKTHKVEKADGMTDSEIRIAVIKAVRGDSLDLNGKSEDYIMAAFDLCKVEETQHADALKNQRKDTMTHSDNNNQDSNEDSYKKLLDAEAKMYLKGRE